MRNCHRCISSLAIIITSCLLAPVVARSADVQRHMVVISIDGFASYLVDDPKVPLPNAILVAKDGYAVSGSVNGETLVTTHKEARTSLGSHGFLAKSPKMNAMCILSGAGIRSGVKLRRVRNTAIAPTIATILGLKYPGTDGKPLLDAIRASK